MQTIAPRAVVQSAATVTASFLRRAEAQGVRWPGIAGVWRDTLSAFAAHGPSILTLAIIGFAGTMLIGLSISQVLRADDLRAAYLHASGPLASHAGLSKLSLSTEDGLFVLLLAQSALGLFLSAFARGAVTYLALHGGGWRAACRMALKRLPALVTGTLVCSAFIGFGAVSVNAWLRNADHDLSDAGQMAVTIDGAQQVMLLRSVNALVPDPGSPVSEFVPHLRHTVFKHLEAVPDYNQKLVDEYGGAATGVGLVIAPKPVGHADEASYWVIAGLLAFVIGGMLLRFWAVMTMQSAGLIAPLGRSVDWGIRYAGIIAFHGCVVRLAMWAFSVVFIVAPVVIAQCFGVDVLTKLGLPRDLVSLPAMIAGVALVNSMRMAFGAVYDARLYWALSRPLTLTLSLWERELN